MREKITVTYYISDDGWIYTDSFGCAMLEGRIDREVGITEGAFSGTAIPHRVQKELYERELRVTESPAEVRHP